ncbi:MAG: type II secretion system F family protein [Bacteriovoracaceae bacterium]|nr:type II secretion system F family protein [Bacteriovoracaceae bacterium]
MDTVLIQGSPMLHWTSILLFGLAAYILARMIFQDEDSFKAGESLQDAEENRDASKDGMILKYSRPFYKRYFLPIVKGMKGKNNFRDKYKKKIAQAGLTKNITPDEVVAFKLFLIIGFPIVFLVLKEFLEADWPLSYVPLVSIVGFFYPDIWINGVIDRRKKDVIRNMPFIVDLLALSVEAGLDFVAAMTRVIEKAPKSSLAEEFDNLIREIKIGSSRAEALRQLSWRIDVLQVSSFTATLIAADSVGASIGPILKTLAVDMRGKRAAEIEKQGATAGTKMLIPMMIFIMPAVGMVVLAPAAMQLISGGP